MNRRVWTGVVAGVLAAAVLLTVGVGAYRAGQDDQVVTRTVDDGEVVRVVEHGRDFFFPGFLLFALLIIAGVVLLARSGRRHWHRPYGAGGPGWGPGCSPGYWGGGPGRGPWGPGGYDLQDWHRRMHEADQPGEAADAPGPADAPGSSEPGPSGPSGRSDAPPRSGEGRAGGPADASPAP